MNSILFIGERVSKEQADFLATSWQIDLITLSRLHEPWLDYKPGKF
jgi:hypothetical protein